MTGLRCVQLGSGANLLPEPWENYDREVDISRPLPFANKSIDRLFCEHTIEHIGQRDGILFLLDCARVLQPGGFLRLSFPQLALDSYSTKYARFVADRFGLADPADLVACGRFILHSSGHQSAWCADLACRVLMAAGFDLVWDQVYGRSAVPELRDVDGHHHAVGLAVAIAETGIVEAKR